MISDLDGHGLLHHYNGSLMNLLKRHLSNEQVPISMRSSLPSKTQEFLFNSLKSIVKDDVEVQITLQHHMKDN
jgi:hypothetical protein